MALHAIKSPVKETKQESPTFSSFDKTPSSKKPKFERRKFIILFIAFLFLQIFWNLFLKYYIFLNWRREKLEGWGDAACSKTIGVQ